MPLLKLDILGLKQQKIEKLLQISHYFNGMVKNNTILFI